MSNQTRRDFIGQTAATAAALLTSRLQSGSAPAFAEAAAGRHAPSAPSADPFVIDLANEALNAARSAGASYADARVGRYRRQLIQTRERQVSSVSDEESYGLGIRTLVGHDSDFAPLLPDDDEPIGERTEALSQWVQGFLYGLGSGVTGDHARVSPEAGEIVRDFIEIAHGGEAVDDSEESEMAFAEVVEFVRVGVQLLFVELAPARGQEAAPGAASIH